MFFGDGGPGGVVRSAHQDHAGAVGDRIEHSLQVVGTVGQVRNLHAFCAQQPHQNGVCLKGTPGVYDFVLHTVGIDSGKRFEDLVECTQASGTGHYILGIQVEPLGERFTQLR